ncbi:hypothetical protein AM232_07830 [Bacillus sp. FJAT-21352]|nr:hypothetical protein AM232_07830 [Bacillus sp. FJAT-21352]
MIVRVDFFVFGVRSYFEASEKELTINYHLDTKHLQPLTLQDLIGWKDAYNLTTNIIHPIDVLYKQHNLTEDFLLVQI